MIEPPIHFSKDLFVESLFGCLVIVEWAILSIPNEVLETAYQYYWLELYNKLGISLLEGVSYTKRYDLRWNSYFLLQQGKYFQECWFIKWGFIQHLFKIFFQIFHSRVNDIGIQELLQNMSTLLNGEWINCFLHCPCDRLNEMIQRIYVLWNLQWSQVDILHQSEKRSKAI